MAFYGNTPQQQGSSAFSQIDPATMITLLTMLSGGKSGGGSPSPKGGGMGHAPVLQAPTPGAGSGTHAIAPPATVLPSAQGVSATPQAGGLAGLGGAGGLSGLLGKSGSGGAQDSITQLANWMRGIPNIKGAPGDALMQQWGISSGSGNPYFTS